MVGIIGLVNRAWRTVMVILDTEGSLWRCGGGDVNGVVFRTECKMCSFDGSSNFGEVANI